MVDLHVHSTFSDGSLTPAELVAAAEREALTAIGLTDHDTMAGHDALRRAAAGSSVECVPGVEISVTVKSGTMHMLGYFVSDTNADLQTALERIRAGRQERNIKILAKLRERNMTLTWEEVLLQAGGDVVGRSHFARALLVRGFVGSTREAFDLYLAKGKPAYVDRFRLGPADAIALIRGAGGMAVLAHPGSLGVGSAELRDVARDLKEVGLEGIEVYYPEHSADAQKAYIALAQGLRLLVTGGTDFHGSSAPDVQLGRGRGRISVPDEVVARMHSALATRGVLSTGSTGKGWAK